MKISAVITITYVLLALTSQCIATNFINCTTIFQIENFQLGDCNDNGPGDYCQIIKGTQVPVSFDVNIGELSSAVNSLSLESYVIYRGHETPVSVIPTDPCAVIGCPVQENSRAHYEAVLDLSSVIISTSGFLTWNILGADGSLLLCWQVLTAIV